MEVEEDKAGRGGEVMTEKDRFVAFLENLREDRAALAALRRGLGQPPGTEPQMYRYVEPFLHENNRHYLEEPYYLIASLFAYHPEPGGSGNMGNHFALTLDHSPNADNTAIERRFVALLAAHPDDLHFYLRQAVSFLRSKDKPINWEQLLWALRHWDNPKRFVQHNWARAFWGGKSEGQQETEETTEGG
jgi:CRISPR system Cascade subunit CasB